MLHGDQAHFALNRLIIKAIVTNPYVIESMDIKTGTTMTLEIKPEQEACAANTTITADTNSEKLFHGKRELVIAHGADHYRLRLTSQGKLILTK